MAKTTEAAGETTEAAGTLTTTLNEQLTPAGKSIEDATAQGIIDMRHQRDGHIETADTSETENDKIRIQIRDTNTAANDFANAYV